ncbi:MAG: rhodanese-like domain-containing protein [Thermodesulfobacteriota bacterium]
MEKKNIPYLFLALAFAILITSGCDSSSSSHSKNPTVTPSEPLTGDVSLFPNAGLLASAEELLAKRAVSKDPIIIDTRATQAYAAGHIPGAINLQWGDFSVWDGSATDGTLLPRAELEAALGAAGLTRDTDIVVYDDTTASWGSAGRFFWMLEYMGNTHVRILNGGWDKWAADGLPTETTINNLPAAQFNASVNAGVLADKEDIAARRGDGDFLLVDTRTDEEFNGWQLYGEARGGHITGAVHLPYEWLYNSDKSILSYANLKSLFDERGITADKEVVGYCTAGIRSGFLYFLGRLMGFTRVANYDASIWDWAAADEAAYPMDRLENYQALVYPAWVKALIDYHASGSSTSPPPGYGYDRNHRYLIFETQWGSFEDMAKGWADDSYLKGHIPGAFHSNSDTYENGYPRWFLLPEAELKAAVGGMGITADTTVVVYSNSPIFAARLWWILKYAGVQDVRFLNGGIAAWEAAGYATETAINEPTAVTYTGTLQAEMIASTAQVEEVYNNEGTILADVRTYPEYTGDTSGYSYVVQKGRIPGAVYAFNADTPDLEYLDADGSLKNFADVRRMWEEIGIESSDSNTFEKDVIFYCGSGYRSSLSFLYAYLMGYENIRNYSDGWEGWSTDYIEDASYTAPEDLPGATDGWIQDPSGRPVAFGVYPEYDFDGYPNVNRLVNAKWIKTVLMDNDNFGKPYTIVFTSWYPRWETNEISTTGAGLPFATEGHIPGAVFLDTYSVETGPTSEYGDGYADPSHSYVKSLPVLQDFFAGMGITKDKTVVVYADDDISMMTAGRIAWALLYAGVADVRILNGSYKAWTEAGYPVETGPTSWTPVVSFGESSGRPEFLATTEDVRNVINGTDTDSVVVDDREWTEFTGQSNSYYWWFEEYGRIPTAKWIGDWVDVVSEDHQSFISFKDAENNWTRDGFTPDKKMYFYCGGGARSAMYTFYAYMMGWPAANYEGGWYLWSTDDSNPRETGIPE